MQISKKDFHRYLSEYTEDEIFTEIHTFKEQNIRKHSGNI